MKTATAKTILNTFKIASTKDLQAMNTADLKLLFLLICLIFGITTTSDKSSVLSYEHKTVFALDGTESMAWRSAGEHTTHDCFDEVPAYLFPTLALENRNISFFDCFSLFVAKNPDGLLPRANFTINAKTSTAYRLYSISTKVLRI